MITDKAVKRTSEASVTGFGGSTLTMASSDADLMSVGQHCSVPSCATLDFLPFHCDCCKKVFCLEHRTYAGHQCAAAGQKEVQVFICPLCACSVRLVHPQQDPNDAWAEHAARECNPANYARVHKKPRCPAGGCKEKLTTINTYSCKTCGQQVCLKHRMPEDHACSSTRRGREVAATTHRQQPGTRGTAMGLAIVEGVAGHASSMVRHASTLAQQAQASIASAVAGTGNVDSGNTVRGTAQRRRDLLQRHEACTQCGALFATAAELAAHAQRSHGATATLVDGDRGMYACHRCAARFSDPVALVAHDELCRTSSQPAQCVLS